MEIKDEVFQHLEVVARSRNGDILGIALFTLIEGLLSDTYFITEFLIEMCDQQVITSDSAPSEVTDYIDSVTIYFPDRDDTTHEVIQISKLFFPDFGTINYRFFNKEISEAFGGSIDM